MPTRLPFDSSPQVASGLALLFIIVLSAAVGWVTLSASANIVQHIQASPLADIEARQIRADTNMNR